MYRSPKPRSLDRPVSIIIRPPAKASIGNVELTCCTNVRGSPDTVSCGQRGGREVIRALRRGIRARDLDVAIVASGCLGACTNGPNIRIAPSNSWMSGARVEDVPTMLDAIEQIIAEHEDHPIKNDAD